MGFITLGAVEVVSYEELASALRAGNQFTVVLDLQKCSQKAGMPTGYFVPSAMMLVPGTEQKMEHITASHLHFTDRGKNPLYEYVKYTFYADGTVELATSFYDIATFAPVGTPHSMQCTMGKGIYIHAK